MGYTALITCLQRINTASAIYRHGPPSAESHSVLKQALIEGYLVLATQEHDDPLVDGIRPQILRLCQSLMHALDFGVMEFAPEAPSRHTAKEFCAELSALVGSLMPHLMATEMKGRRSPDVSKPVRDIEVLHPRHLGDTAPTPGPLRGARVLIAEDDFFIAQYLGEIVQDAGGMVIGPASDVSNACTLAAAALPDCAVLDMQLRGSDASPVVAFLDGAGIPFVIVAGYQRDGLPSHLGWVPYLSKPFSRAELLNTLAMLWPNLH
jgi:CheY-like chemotaxis protein